MMTNNPPVCFTQEIRFAVVMYGGSSLCIYMNGVAQELLRLVRATAPDPAARGQAYLPDGSDKLGGSGQVYRRLGQMLSRGDDSLKVRVDKSIRTRFVIDVLSGTSAGGINAVYLAKALANDQDLESLKKLWIETADMDILMNDNHSSGVVPLAAQKQPRSLLNSRLMYHLLLESLGDMDRQKNSSVGESPSSPYADELDLYVTATDIVGRKIRLRLADTIARERRHLNMFHFHCSNKHSTEKAENDFKAGNNPFLAFAARCTSAHPVPFEPVTLSDIDESLAKLNLNARSSNKDWQTFYEEYLQPEIDLSDQAKVGENAETTRKRLAEEFRIRPFNDGGILDNSPFSFAIDSLQFRHADLPVDRKLLYIEPVPEHPELEVDSMSKPDALTTGLLSLSVLPRYQFIREDLERILERNRLIERVQRILKGIERDEIDRLIQERDEAKRKHLEASKQAAQTHTGQRATDTDAGHPEARTGPLNAYEFGQSNLRDMIARMGSAWGGYQRLRVAETTDDLVAMIARAAGYDDKSDEILAISYLVRAWRAQNYFAYGEERKGEFNNEESVKPNKKTDKETENSFLFKYDLKWRIRRLKFVLKKIDEISYFHVGTEEIPSIAMHLDVFAKLGETEASKRVSELSALPDEFRTELGIIKDGMSEVLRSLLIARRKLLSRATGRQSNDEPSLEENNPIVPAIKALAIQPGDILSILKLPTDKARQDRAENIVKNENFRRFGEDLENMLKAPMVDASVRVKGPKNNPEKGLLHIPESPTEGENTAPTETSDKLMARHILRYYYNNFDRYDMISYPILYATNVGEEVDTVEVFRISPEDAGNLVKDMKDRKRKLAGTSLGNFGAFFDKDFRRNDILWGRLDAAERIVTALLSSVPVKDQNERDQLTSELIMDAQRAILAEEFTAEDKTGLRGLLGAALDKTKSDADNVAFRELLNEQLKVEPPNLAKVREFLDVCLTGTDPLLHFRDTHLFTHDMKPDVMLRLAGRASKVFGKMLEGMAESRRIEKKRLVWVTRITHLFWGLVEVAVPGSYGDLIFKYWLKLLYTFEVLLFVVGSLLGNAPMQRLGLTAFGITALINIVVHILRDLMRSRRTMWSIVKSLAKATVLVFAAIGAVKIAGFVPVTWVVNNFNLLSGWLGRFLPQSVVNSSGVLLPVVVLLGVIVILTVVVVVVDALKQSLNWIRENMERGLPEFKPITIKNLKREQISKAVQADASASEFVFPFRLSGKPTPDWAEYFRRQWKDSNSVAQSRVDDFEIQITCAHKDLRQVVPQLKAAVSSANQTCIKDREDAKRYEDSMKLEAEVAKKARGNQERANDKALAGVSKLLKK